MGSTAELSKSKMPTSVAEFHYASYLNPKGTDGVSRMMEANDRVLRQHGLRVHVYSGDVPAGVPNGTLVPELDFDIPPVATLRSRMYVEDYAGPEAEREIHAELDRQIGPLARVMGRAAQREDIVIARNIPGITIHPGATVALPGVVDGNPSTLFVNFPHDLNERRPGKYNNRYKTVRERLDAARLPQGPNVINAVINNRERRLLESWGINAVVVYDSLDFSEGSPKPVKTEHDRRKVIEQLSDGKIRPNDLIMVNGNRVIDRKAHEVTIQLAAEFQKKEYMQNLIGKKVGIHGTQVTNESRVVVVLPQSKNLDKQCFDKVQKLANELGVTLVYAGDKVVADSAYDSNSDKIPYSSVFQFADLQTMTSIEEGLGDNLLVGMKNSNTVPMVYGWETYEDEIEPALMAEGGHVTKIGSHKEEIDYIWDPQKNLWLLNPQLARRTVRAQQRLLLDPEREEAIAKVNRRAVSRKFGAEKIGNEFYDVLVNAYRSIQ